MYQQKTVQEMENGGLYIVATPIGNLGDITFRAVEILKQVDYILAEDTRVAAKLLQHLSIDQAVISCHEHNQYDRIEEISQGIMDGNTYALISDAGLPCISDPGSVIVSAFIERKIPFTVIPGASAGISSYVLSGMSEKGQFIFHGFLPTKAMAKEETLAQYVESEKPIIFYESPNRIVKTLTAFVEVFTPHTRVAIFRELTKMYETITWVSVRELQTLDLQTLDTWKGELVVIVAPEKEETVYDEKMLMEALESRVDDGERLKDATKELAKLAGISSKVLYKMWQDREKER